MMPVPTQDTFKLVKYGKRSWRSHTHKKVPTICLLAARQYCRCGLLIKGDEGEFSPLYNLVNSSSLSSKETKSDKLNLGFGLSCRCSSEPQFKAWRIRESHLSAGPLSSGPSTFPAFRGTISWNLQSKKEKKFTFYPRWTTKINEWWQEWKQQCRIVSTKYNFGPRRISGSRVRACWFCCVTDTERTKGKANMLVGEK